ncbi:MAG: tyrosine-type recombinase/integrase [Nitrososphaeraceae archaeon]|nr:tyrosine-type recombinase/integrase [Nitrososphaeraceae archaeon]
MQDILSLNNTLSINLRLFLKGKELQDPQQQRQRQESEHLQHNQHQRRRQETAGDNRPPKLYHITSGNLAPLTIEQYERDVNQFLHYFKIKDIQVLLDFGRDAIQAMVIKYISEHLREQRKLGHGSIKLHVAGLYYFLDGEDIILNRQKIRRHYPRDDFIHDDRCYTREEIQSILSKCDERTRAMVLLMVSSGMRIGALRELQIGDLPKALVPNLNLSLFKIWVYARSRDRYYTFCTPECRAAVLDYLATRERFGEDITKKTSPLFREQYNLADHLRIQSPAYGSRRQA